jgi:hypothetical protein
MAAKILRLYRNEEFLSPGEPNPNYKPGEPLLSTEVLSRNEPPDWSRNLDQFHQFHTNGEAEERVAQLRSKGITHCFVRPVDETPQRPPIEEITLPAHPLDKSAPAPRIDPSKVRLPYRDD